MSDHYRIVYRPTMGEGQIVSLTHQPLDRAASMAELCNKAARLGTFTVEDEREQEQAA